MKWLPVFCFLALSFIGVLGGLRPAAGTATDPPPSLPPSIATGPRGALPAPAIVQLGAPPAPATPSATPACIPDAAASQAATEALRSDPRAGQTAKGDFVVVQRCGGVTYQSVVYVMPPLHGGAAAQPSPSPASPGIMPPRISATLPAGWNLLSGYLAGGFILPPPPPGPASPETAIYTLREGDSDYEVITRASQPPGTVASPVQLDAAYWVYLDHQTQVFMPADTATHSKSRYRRLSSS